MSAADIAMRSAEVIAVAFTFGIILLWPSRIFAAFCILTGTIWVRVLFQMAGWL